VNILIDLTRLELVSLQDKRDSLIKNKKSKMEGSVKNLLEAEQEAKAIVDEAQKEK